MEGQVPQPRTTAKRPESTLAQSFAADLDSMFGLDPVVDGLAQTVNEKKASIDSGSKELQELEARLKATEERLARVSRSSSPARAPPPPPSSAAPPPPTSANQYRNDQQQLAGAHGPPQARTSPLSQKPSYPPDRPPTAPSHRPPPPPTLGQSDAMPSNMPGQFPSSRVQQQQNMGNDYVMVERGGSRMNEGYRAA